MGVDFVFFYFLWNIWFFGSVFPWKNEPFLKFFAIMCREGRFYNHGVMKLRFWRFPRRGRLFFARDFDPLFSTVFRGYWVILGGPMDPSDGVCPWENACYLYGVISFFSFWPPMTRWSFFLQVEALFLVVFFYYFFCYFLKFCDFS